MADVGKLLMIGGAVLLVVGAVVFRLGRAGIRGLPGDISFQSSNVRVYFPVVSCVVISLLLTLGVWLFRRMSGR